MFIRKDNKKLLFSTSQISQLMGLMSVNIHLKNRKHVVLLNKRDIVNKRDKLLDYEK